MRPKSRHIEFTNGHAHFYNKKKVDRIAEKFHLNLVFIASIFCLCFALCIHSYSMSIVFY